MSLYVVYINYYTCADLPLILVLLVYTDKFFNLKIWQNIDFFCGRQKAFPYTGLIHSDQGSYRLWNSGKTMEF